MITRFVVAALIAGVSTSAMAQVSRGEVDPAPYGGGTCKAMTQNHDPKSLWVGRYTAMWESDGGGGGAIHDIACFTAQKPCMEWVNRDSGQGGDRIIEMKCHHGLGAQTWHW